MKKRLFSLLAVALIGVASASGTAKPSSPLSSPLGVAVWSG